MTGKIISWYQDNIQNLVRTIVVCFTICMAFGMTTSNVLYLVFGMMYYIISKKTIFLETREKHVCGILSILFAVFMVMGNIEMIIDECFIPWPIMVLLCLYGFYLCFSCLLSYVLIFVRNLKLTEDTRVYSKKKVFQVMCISLLGLLLLWGLGLAISYPGNTTKDSNVYFEMVLGKRDMWAAISPIYILMLRFMWNVGEGLLGSVNAGIALFSLMQILIMALIISYMVRKLYIRKIKNSIIILVWLFYAIIPYNVQLPHTIWRDIPFSVSVFLLSVLAWDLYLENRKKCNIAEVCKLTLIIVSVIGIAIMKGNGIFAYLFFLPFGMLIFWRRNVRVVITLIMAFVLARVVQGPISDKIMNQNAVWINGLQVSTEETQNDIVVYNKSPNEDIVVNNVPSNDDEVLNNASANDAVVVKNATDSYNSTGIYIITAQQLARVAVSCTDLEGEEYQRLNRVIDIEEIREKYNPHVSDRAMAATNHELTMVEYLKEWIYFGAKYPMQYILAYKDQTMGYWYPDVQYWVYFDTIRENEFGLYRESILPENVKEFLFEIEEIYKQIPIYGLVWSIGFVVWITLLSIGIVVIRKEWQYIFLYFPVLGVWATLLIAAPAYAEFRYIYSMFLCLPLSILMPFCQMENKENIE